jgi:hypothetical protein
MIAVYRKDSGFWQGPHIAGLEAPNPNDALTCFGTRPIAWPSLEAAEAFCGRFPTCKVRVWGRSRKAQTGRKD